MKVKILKEEFKKALTVCERITRKNITLPILQGILLRAEGSFLELNTTNLETTIRWWVLAKIEKNGNIVVPAGLLANLVGLIGEDEIELCEEKKSLVLITQSQENQIQGQDSEEFPIIPKIEKKNSWQMSSEQLIEGLSGLIDIPSPTQTRSEAMSGILFTFKKNKLNVAGTDSFRLAEKSVILKEDDRKDGSFILPQNSARELLNVLGQIKGYVNVHLDPNQIMFEFFSNNNAHAQLNLLSRLIDGEFPSYQEIIPKKYTTRLRVEREGLIRQVKKAGLFSGKLAEIKLSVDNKEQRIKILSQTVDLGKNESLLSATVEGQDLIIGLNHHFLTEGLNSIKSSEVLIDFNGDDKACAIKPVGDVSYVYVLMPIKMT